jgi:hypothetical protein
MKRRPEDFTVVSGGPPEVTFCRTGDLLSIAEASSLLISHGEIHLLGGVEVDEPLARQILIAWDRNSFNG